MYKGYEDLSGTYWRRIIKGASTRGLVFDITIKDAWDLYLMQDRRCALTGGEIVLVSDWDGRRQENTASLDRIDNDIGYIIGNIQWVHREINMMRRTHSVAYFIELCKKVAVHNSGV